MRSAISQLTAAGVPSPRMNAELLLMFTIGRDRAFLYGHPEQLLPPEDLARYQAALAQRVSGIPAQYITGRQEFWGMELVVSPAVLIPRPETEHVVETVLGLAPASADTKPAHLSIADVGTGSGCIALALAKELPAAEIHANDISSAALDVARANAARHGMAHRVAFHEADLLSGVEKTSLDFVVSNPPYVGESEEDTVQLEVRKFEPRTAVFAGPKGTEVIERLIAQARDVLKPGGWLVMEISGTISEAVRRLLADWSEIRITNDLQGIPRVAAARRL